MAQEAHFELPFAVKLQEMPIPPILDPHTTEQQPLLPDAEQVRAADAVFAAQDAAQDHESQQVQGILGLWAGTLLLHDLAIDHLDRPTGEFEEEENKKRKGEDPE